MVATFTKEVGVFPTVTEPTNVGSMTFAWKGLPPGNYATSMYHDEENNRAMKKNGVSIPKVFYGFSHNFNPNTKLRAPHFSGYVFIVKDGSNQQQITPH